MGETLQILNLLLTGSVLVAVIAAAVAYGKLTQKVEDHGRRLDRLETTHTEVCK